MWDTPVKTLKMKDLRVKVKADFDVEKHSSYFVKMN